jgi:hypothetical protein
MAVVAILTLLLGPVTSWAGGATVRHLTGKDKADAINGVRQTLLQAAAGTAALTVLVFTGLTFTLNRRGQVTDRYTKAIGLLASEKLDERIGGIYALEHIMVESERDHETVVQVLAAFVREHAAIGTTRSTLWIDPPRRTHDDEPDHDPAPATDIQTALTVLGRRPTRKENQPLDLRSSDLRGASLGGAHLEDADLSGANLERADLGGAHLEHAYLGGANLAYADLGEAHLKDAYLIRANLKRASLGRAHLEHADLGEANLERAYLGGANLERAYLGGANLERASLGEAHLERADLSTAEALTQGQIERAVVDDQTKLPARLGDGSSAESSS